MKIYKHLYDNNMNTDGTEKDNEYLGDFELIDGDMNDYSYEVIVRSKEDNEIYILTGREVSGYYNPGKGGTTHSIEKLSENYFVKMYLSNQSTS